MSRSQPRLRILLAALGAALVLGVGPLGCGGDDRAPTPATEPPAVTGTVTYAERVALPPQGVEVELMIIDQSDSQAPDPGEQRLDDPGQVPIAFSIPYDPGDVVEDHSYGVLARIRVDGEIWFENDVPEPVLTGGAPSHDVQIPLGRGA